MKTGKSTLAHLVSSLEEFGADDATISHALARCDLTKRNANSVASNYPAESEAKFVVEACDAVDDITFAAQAGLSRMAYSSISDYVGKYSKDLRSAIEHTSRIHDADSPALGWGLRLSGNSAVLELFWKEPGFAKYHRYAEYVMFAALARIRSITQSHLRPIEMRFVHEVGKSASDFEKLASCPVKFGAENLEMLLPFSALDLPIPTYDHSLREHLLDYGKRLSDERGPNQLSLRSRVEGLLLSALPTRMLNAAEVASGVGMSPRTLARRLESEGTSFRQIVDDLRCDLAKTFMTDEMSLPEIAFALRYADQAAFSTAFKRWTGVAPSTYSLRT